MNKKKKKSKHISQLGEGEEKNTTPGGYRHNVNLHEWKHYYLNYLSKLIY